MSHERVITSDTRSAVGFIVHPTWQLRGGIAEIHLYGRLRNGETFLIIDTHDRPRFYVRAGNRERTRKLVSRLGCGFASTSRRTIDGEPVEAVNMTAPGKTGRIRRVLREAGIRTYEADIPYPWAYLMDRHIRGAIEIRGPWQPGDPVNRVYRNPELAPCDWEPDLGVASMSIELDPSTGGIRAAALVASGPHLPQEVSVHLATDGAHAGSATQLVADEPRLLMELRQQLCALDPDLLVGWNIVSGVLGPLKARCTACGIPFNWGRSHRLSKVDLPAKEPRQRGGRAIIEGRQILDARSIARAGQRRFDDLNLVTVAQAMLGYAPSNASERARAVLGILETDNLLQLTVRRSLLIGIPLQRAWTSVQAFDFLYIGELHQRGLVAPTRDVDRRGGAPAPGGLILPPQAGVARNILVFDFKSLYPSVVRTFNIDPATQTDGIPNEQDLIQAPNGACFTRTPGILPSLLDRFFDSRDRAKARGDAVASYAYKIIMNSFYGVLGTSSCRFASQSLSGAITSFGQHILRWTRDALQSEGLTILYGDTDSLFVDAGLPFDTGPETARQRGQSIADRLNVRLADYLGSTYGVDSRLELEMEKVYKRFFLPTVRGEERGRAKGYAGLVETPKGDRVEIVGMEAVRRDWTDLARRFQRELLDLAFHDAPDDRIEHHVLETIQRLRGGELDDELVYRRSLRKPLTDYTKTQPPHVRAAALLSEEKRPGDVIRYVITQEGPRPLGYVDAPLDYGHIIKRQLQPIARTLAPLVDIPDHLFGSGQMELF